MSGREIKPLSLHDYGSYYLINNEDFGIEVPAYMGIEVAKVFHAAPRLAAALERCADALDSFACDPPGFPSVEWTEEDAEAVREASAALREAGVES